MKVRILSFMIYWLVRLMACTVRITAQGEEGVLPGDHTDYRSVILVGWHGQTFIAANRYRNRGYWSMISTSRDGEMQNAIFRRFGFNSVRGSTSARGAVEAALKLRRELEKGGVLALTPDGPRGPRGVFHPGAIYLAQKVQCPLVPVGVSSWPCWKLPTWDNFQIPKPFSRAVMVYGECVPVPKHLDNEGRQELADRMGKEIDKVQAEADRLVGMPVETVTPMDSSGDSSA